MHVTCNCLLNNHNTSQTVIFSTYLVYISMAMATIKQIIKHDEYQ